MLGSTFTLGLLLTFYLSFVLSSPIWRLAFFLTTLSTFHYLEFLTTAAYNTRAADTSSFLLTANWPAYAIAHTVAFLECFLAHFFLLPSSWGISFFLTPYHVLTSPFVVFLGLLLVIMGQAIRSLAMIHAGPSFNHHVQFHRSYDHVLVTTGIYSLLRHPSYFGFFYWALGTQLVMGNVLSLIGYAVVLGRFFKERIGYEEEALVRMFGAEYDRYRERVGTGLFFVR
mgnify:FL=1